MPPIFRLTRKSTVDTTLEELVANLVKDPQASAEMLRSYQETADLMQGEAQEVGRRLAENMEYRVGLYFNDRTKDVSVDALQKLREAGFNAAAMDLSEVREFLTTSQAAGSAVRTSPTFGFDTLDVNVIAYTPGAIAKAEEVRDLLARLPGFRKANVLPRRVFTERFGDSFLAEEPWKQVFAGKLLEVYFVQPE